MSRKDDAARQDSYVRFAVLGGPVWNSYRSHTGEIERFYVTKVACKNPKVLDGDKVPIADCKLIFARPVIWL